MHFDFSRQNDSQCGRIFIFSCFSHMTLKQLITAKSAVKTFMLTAEVAKQLRWLDAFQLSTPQKTPNWQNENRCLTSLDCVYNSKSCQEVNVPILDQAKKKQTEGMTTSSHTSPLQTSRLNPVHVFCRLSNMFPVVKMQMGTADSFLEWGWGLWTALRGVDPAAGTTAWFGGCCCLSPGGWTFSSASGSTAGYWRSRTGGVRWRSCRSRGCSSCWGWPAGQRVWRWCSQSLWENRVMRRQYLIWGEYFSSRGSVAVALTHWRACWMFILTSCLRLSLSFA